MKEARHHPIGARITGRLVVLGVLWLVYSAVFIGLCVALTGTQVLVLAAVLPLALAATLLALWVVHRIRFARIGSALFQLEEGKDVALVDLEELTRYVLAYPGWLALLVALIGVIFFGIGTAAASFLTRFRNAQVLSVVAGGLSLWAIFALVAYLDVKAMIGPALSVLVSKTGGFCEGRRISLMRSLWVFSLAIAIVPLFFLGFLFYNRSIDAIETQMKDDGRSRIAALAEWLGSEKVESEGRFKMYLRMFAGKQGSILWVEPKTGKVILDSSRADEILGEKTEGEGQTEPEPSPGIVTLSMYSLDADIVRRILASTEPGDARDILSGQIVVYAPVEKTLETGKTQSALLVYVFRRMGSKLNLALTMVLVFGIAIVFLLFWMIHIYGAGIRIPLQELQIVSERISRGDLTQDVPVLSDDEVGSLGLAFQVMVNYLRTLIRRVQGATGNVTAVATRLADGSKEIALGSHHQVESVDETARSIEEINLSIGGIADSVEELASSALQSASSITEMGQSIREVDGQMDSLSRSIENTAGSIQEMVASIAQIASNVERLKHEGEATEVAMQQIDVSSKEIREHSGATEAYADRVIADASRGEEDVARTIKSIHNMREVSGRATNAMRTLASAIDEIGEILAIQKGITDGTNLLALNAAIIAAHTGEHGKQFGVIASEIKGLARKSRERTKDIEDLIEKVQLFGKGALEAVEAGYHSIEEGLKLASAAGDSLTQILESSKQSTGMVKRIATATAEQEKGVRFALEAVERIVEGVAEIAKATNEQKRGSELITETTDEIRTTGQFVKRSTQEQSIGSAQIERNIERIRERVDSIHRATGELRRGSERVVAAAELIRGASRRNETMVQRMIEEVSALFGQSEEMRAAVAKFTLNGVGRGGGNGEGLEKGDEPAGKSEAEGGEVSRGLEGAAAAGKA